MVRSAVMGPFANTSTRTASWTPQLTLWAAEVTTTCSGTWPLKTLLTWMV